MSLKISPGRADVYHAEGQKNGRTDGQTDRHDKGKGRFSPYYERTKKTEKQRILK